MKKIAVSGSGGFIASHVIDRLYELGYEVVGIARTADLVLEEGNYLGDIRDKSFVRAVVEKVDGVIHLAGLLGTKNMNATREFYETNLFGALNVFDACVEFNVPVIQIAVGNHHEYSDYSNSKVAVERELIKYVKYKGLKGALVRGYNAYGEGQRYKHTGKIIPTFIYKALHNEPIPVHGGEDKCGIMDMIYVGDLANILVTSWEQLDEGTLEPGSVVEAGSGVGLSVWEIAETVKRLAGSESEIVEVPMPPGYSQRSRVVADKVNIMATTDFEEGIKQTIEDYKTYGFN